MYISPFGKSEDLSTRLREFAQRLGADRVVPWCGLGPIADLLLAANLIDDPAFIGETSLDDIEKATDGGVQVYRMIDGQAAPIEYDL